MTTIEWTHRPGTKGETWNPIRARNRATGGVGHYCAHVSEGCRNSYAEAMQGWRFDNPIRYAAQDRDKVELFLDEKVLTQPLRWRQPRTVFVCSMTDLYGDWVPDEWIDRIKAVEALCPQHTFIELTKRPERMRQYLRQVSDERDMTRWLNAVAEISGGWDAHALDHADWPLRNVWEGTSVEDQESGNRNIPELLATPAVVRIVSYEPALGPVDFTVIEASPSFYFNTLIKSRTVDGEFAVGFANKIDGVFAGGESGRGARPPHPDWFRSVRDQCVPAGVAFFFKQWGEYRPYREGEPTKVITEVQPDGRCWATDIMNPAGALMVEVGKKAAGRLLDGVEWSMWPEVVVAQ